MEQTKKLYMLLRRNIDDKREMQAEKKIAGRDFT
jgi:hypothetical protein